MCTLTFLPKKNGAFILTSSRDEIASRGKTDFPISKQILNKKVVFPQDPLKGGTWLALEASGKTLCLLNGAFKKHQHNPPYRKSRGIVLLDVLKYDKFADFTKNYDFSEIEPFTLICAEYGKKSRLYEFRWDGKKHHLLILDSEYPKIWSSATLYNKEQRDTREQWFSDWIKGKTFTNKLAFEFHLNSGDTNPSFAIKMKRTKGPETVSISQISKTEDAFSFRHKNLISTSDTTYELKTEIISHV